MRPEVRGGWSSFNERFEGRLRKFYLDVEGLVTIGVGDLVDPIEAAHALDYENDDGSPAGWHDVTASWVAVKSAQSMRLRGGGAFQDLQGNRVRATEASIDRLVNAKLSAFEADIVKAWPAWEVWPAQSQTALLSMCWAMGSGFFPHWPAFVAACRAQDWKTAADECQMRDADNPGLRPRNRANMALFLDATSNVDVTGGLGPALFIAPDPEESA